MVHSVELVFDPDTEAAVRRIWDGLREAGIASQAPASRPHATLTVAGGSRHVAIRVEDRQRRMDVLECHASQRDPEAVSRETLAQERCRCGLGLLTRGGQQVEQFATSDDLAHGGSFAPAGFLAFRI